MILFVLFRFFTFFKKKCQNNVLDIPEAYTMYTFVPVEDTTFGVRAVSFKIV